MAGNFETWVKANGKWLAAAAAGLVVIMMLSEGEQTQGVPQGGGGPVAGGDQSGGMPYDEGGGMPYDQGSDPGGFDMDKWREEQAADDAQQQERIDRIREVDRCTDPDTGEVHEVPSHIGC